MSYKYYNTYDLIIALGCFCSYFQSPNIFWFVKDPSVIFIINHDDLIILKNCLTEEQISIMDVWRFLTFEQQKLILFNLDKFY